MSKYHVAVVGSRPTKTGNRNDPFPRENAEFIHNVLSRVTPDDYASLSHGATNYGVDSVSEHFAMVNQIVQRQFRSYWFDPTKQGNVNKAAGIQSREAMIRDLSDSIHNKEDHYGMLLVFHTPEDPRSDEGLKALLDFCAKYHPKIQVRTFRLPVTVNPKPAPTTNEVVDLSPTSGIPDPFAVPQ